MAKPEFKCPYRKEYFDPFYKGVYGEEFPGLQSDLLSNKASFLTAGKRDYPGLRIWTHANAAALLRARIGTIDNIIKSKFGGTLPAWLKESGGKKPGRNNPGGKNRGRNNPGGDNPGRIKPGTGKFREYAEKFKSKYGGIRKVADPRLGTARFLPSWDEGSYCQGYLNKKDAEEVRGKMMADLLIGIASAVSPKAVQHWAAHLMGGWKRRRDFSKYYGPVFAESIDTTNWTDDLLEALDNKIKKEGLVILIEPILPVSAWPPSKDKTADIDLTKLIPDELKEVAGKMRFQFVSEVPGNIAGGIGKEKLTGEERGDPRYGKNPWPGQDMRRVGGTAKVTLFSDGLIKVVPHIIYEVWDNVDLCPGQAGTTGEQVATLPISQFEATGISGDTPYFVIFSPTDEKILWYRRAPGSKGGQKGGSKNPKGNNPGNPGPNEDLVKPPGNPGNPGVNPLRSFPSGKSLGWSEAEVARRAVALTAAPAVTPGCREVGAASAAAATSRKVTCYQTVDNVTIHTGGPLDPQALRAALERFMRSEATTVA